MFSKDFIIDKILSNKNDVDYSRQVLIAFNLLTQNCKTARQKTAAKKQIKQYAKKYDIDLAAMNINI